MKMFTANNARTNFAELMDASRREPIAITRHGRTVNVLLAIEDYEKLAQIEDEWWITHQVAMVNSEANNRNIEQAAQEVEKGNYVKAKLIKC